MNPSLRMLIMARKKRDGACSDAEFERVLERLDEGLKAAQDDHGDTSWVDDLPEGDEFDDSDPDSTLVIFGGE
jgi:hypothetical protein